MKMPKITSINERIVFNSRGDKTVEVDVVSDNQFLGKGMCTIRRQCWYI